MLDALTWLLAIEVLGLLALPLCFVLFSRLPDRGLTLAKPLALVLFSYLLWVTGLTHLAPNTRITLIVILLLAAVAGGFVFRAMADRIISFIKEEWRMLVVAEIIFLAFFFLWLGITSETPAISGTEKPMDFGFMNAVLQSRFFPPEDPWLSGHSISYYYFGHFMMAFLAKLTAVPSNVGYNLAISLVPALLAIASFGLIYNLVRLSGGGLRSALGFGLAAPAMIMLLGNLEGVLEFIHAQGLGGDGFWNWVGIKGLGSGPAGSGLLPDDYLWWWRGTRVIDTLVDGQSLDYTITEFPAFSFLLGDLHPHVMSLPFVVLGLSLGLNLFQYRSTIGPGWLLRNPLEAIAIALFVGSLAFINIWDLPLLAGIFAVLILVKNYGEGDGDLQRAVLNAAAALIPILALGVLMFLPFYLTFSGGALGILPLQDVSTRPILFFLAIGLFALLAISFVLLQLPGLGRPTRPDGVFAGLVLAIALMPLVVWGGIVLILTWADEGVGAAIVDVGGRALWVLPGLAIVAVASISAGMRLRRGEETAAAFPLMLVAVAFYLLVGAELFYVNDTFGGAFRRMNTVFKVYYQSWLLLGLAGTYALYFWRSRVTTHSLRGSEPRQPEPGAGHTHSQQKLFRTANWVWGFAVVLMVVGSAYYSVGAVLDRTGILNQNHTLADNTLDGLSFVQSQDPGEYAAILWLRDDAGFGRIVEAVGDDYSDYGRISASTGFPTLLGWKGHELQWRGTSLPFQGREEDVERIYESSDPAEVKLLLEQYQVRYVYLGRRERSDYGGANLAGFGNLLRTAFEQDGVIIYELLN